MVVKFFSASDLKQLEDLINDFLKSLRNDFSPLVSYQIVQASNFIITDNSGVKREVFSRPTFTAMIQY
jgi:hypothetical protein